MQHALAVGVGALVEADMREDVGFVPMGAGEHGAGGRLRGRVAAAGVVPVRRRQRQQQFAIVLAAGQRVLLEFCAVQRGRDLEREIVLADVVFDFVVERLHGLVPIVEFHLDVAVEQHLPAVIRLARGPETLRLFFEEGFDCIGRVPAGLEVSSSRSPELVSMMTNCSPPRWVVSSTRTSFVRR